MKYCSFKEVDKIENMLKKNNYLYGIIDPCCVAFANEDEFNLWELCFIKSLPEDKKLKKNIRIKDFVINTRRKDLTELQPLLKEKGLCVLPRKNFKYKFPDNDKNVLYMSPLYGACSSGLVINVKKVINDLKRPDFVPDQKKKVLKEYNTLLELGYVHFVYTCICKKLQDYIADIEQNNDIEHSCDYSSIFGYIYQGYIEPALLQIQNYFVDFTITEDVVKKDIHLFDFEQERKIYGEGINTSLDQMKFEDFAYAIYSISITGTTRIDNKDVYKTNIKQSSKDEFNSIMHLLVALNAKIQKLLGANYLFEQNEYLDYDTLLENYEPYKQSDDNDLVC